MKGVLSSEGVISLSGLKSFENDDLSVVMYGFYILFKNGVLNNIKWKLDDLKKELEFLKVELWEDNNEKCCDWSYLRLDFFFWDYFMSGCGELILWSK